jgi:hypothetical protein
MKTILLIISLTLLISSFNKPFKYDYKVFTKPYKVVRIDEHELQLINKKDTVVLYLENAYQFKEQIVYIKK